jgi:hypothetical protein
MQYKTKTHYMRHAIKWNMCILYLALFGNILRKNQTRKINHENDVNDTICYYTVVRCNDPKEFRFIYVYRYGICCYYRTFFFHIHP